MSANPEKVAEALRASVKEAQRLRRQNRQLLAAASEPIAIVGMSCRLPGGVSTPEDFWELLDGGRDAIGGLPTDRGWDLEGLYHPDPDHPGTSYVREGGFLGDAGDFDAEFFGLTPREALAMDPQQRLFLEASWEAIEAGGIDPLALRDTQTGVFAGVMYQDYPAGPDVGGMGQMVTSNTGSIVSGRVAYLFGLVGPTMTVDTACSSSLVALHLACGSLRRGECSMALAGGVTVMSQPSLLVGFSMQRGLAMDGRCKSFADAADGTNWGEGVGVLLLERLLDAQSAGHRVLAVLRGSAVNQDGASNGFASPNGPSQQRVIRQALASAGLATSDVDAVEAHGTGTTLGDPIEAQALLSTYGLQRPDERPLLLGSVKSNIAHVQAAAGVAGVIKMVQALRHETLPPTLHVDAPTRHVDWSVGAVELLTESRPWRRGERPRRAGVSSFGISGTNAHLILEEAPSTSEEGHEPRLPGLGTTPWLLSAKSEAALRAQAEALLEHLRRHPELQEADVGFALATGRTHFPQRAALLGEGRDGLLESLARLARGEAGAGVRRGLARGGPTAFMFTGQGAQRPGMGMEIYETFPVFAEALDEVWGAFEPHLERPLRELMFSIEGSPEAQLLDRTEYAQASLFALEVSLFRLLGTLGVRPDMLIGHSIGEIVAAHVGGCFSLADACTLVAARGRLMGALPDGGGMLALEACEQEVVERLEGNPQLSLAAVNGPRAVVLSGPSEALEQWAARWREEGRKTSRLRVSHAFHSILMEPMLEDFKRVADGLELHPAKVPIVCNLTGAPLGAGESHDPAYWVAHVRETVRFAQGVRALQLAGTRRFLEIGPDGVLTAMVGSCLEEQTHEPAPQESMREKALAAPTLRAGRAETAALLSFLAEVHVDGLRVDWRSAMEGRGASLVELPTYAFRRRRYWQEPSADAGDVSAAGLQAQGHPLLGAALQLVGDRGWTFTGRLSLASHPWLADHAVRDVVILPGSGFVELALTVGRQLECEMMEELTLQAPLVLSKDATAQLQLTVGEPDAGGRRGLEIHSRAMPAVAEATAEHEWTCNASAVLAPVRQEDLSSASLELLREETWPPQDAEELDVAGFYERLALVGLQYGPAFQGVTAAWRRDGQLFAEVALEQQQAEQAGRFGVHPALLDAALHAAMLDVDEDSEQDRLLLPFALRDVRLQRPAGGSLRVCIDTAREGELGLAALDGEGVPVLSVGALMARPVDAQTLGALSGRSERDWLFRLDWSELTLGAQEQSVRSMAWLGGLDDSLDWAASHYVDLSELDEAIESGASVPQLVIALARSHSEGEDPVRAAHAGAAHALRLVQDWLSQERWANARLLLVSRGALAVSGEESADPATAAVWGLVRSAATEHPGRLQLVDLDPDPEREHSDIPWATLSALDEPQLALRAGRVFAPRLAWAQVKQPAGKKPLDPAGTILVSGGTGGLGALVARHLASAHGARHILLISRRGESAPGARELVEDMAQVGCATSVVACDVADRQSLASAIQAIPSERPLTAVIHAAGTLGDATIESLDVDLLEGAMRPKVDGAVHLHELTEGMDLSDFVLFSSGAAVIGSPGQAAYAAANAFLDALAQQRHARGLAASSLAWGLWAQATGMTGELGDSAMARLGRIGVDALSSEEGLRLFDLARDCDSTLLVAARLDMDALRGHARMGVLPRLLGGLIGLPTRRSGVEGGSLARALIELSESEREAVVLELVRTHVAGVLGHESPTAIGEDDSFQELGVDSLAAVELRNVLDRVTGLRLPATLVFDHPTPAAVAKFLRSRVEDLDERPAPSRRRTRSQEPIAIVGMGCRYPGGADSPQELWRLLGVGADAMSTFPEGRGWDLQRLYDPDPDHPGTSYVNEGGFLHDADRFDASFFGIGPSEAVAMDPQQRLLLEVSWEACESAGIDPRSLRGSETAVFAGVMSQDYGLAAGALSEHEGMLMPGSGGSVVSGRVAYHLGLEGPAMTVDTACSSSLVALHLACGALRQGECSLALAGGVTVLGTPMAFIAFSQLRGLARDGRCKSFASAADGVGWAEGVGVVALERLSEARRLGHQVLALVDGSAVNQDGASNGFTAPNGPSQERVIRQALADAGLSAADVDAVEAHGTGTALGDPIEAQALLGTYGEQREQGRPLWLGSVKSNLGHTQAAAGVAGVIKMVMAIRHGELPKTLHLDLPSEHVDWSAGGVSLLTEKMPWPERAAPRRAAISSFGITGTNAHVIVSQAPDTPVPAERDMEDGLPAQSGVLAWVLSGHSEAALRAQADKLRRHVLSHRERDADTALSLVSTRSTLDWRAVVLGQTRAELVDGLEAIHNGRVAPNVLQGRTRGSRGRTAFLFTGQGAQRVGMGEELYGEFPVFAQSLDRVCGVFDGLMDCDLRGVLFGEPQSSSPAANGDAPLAAALDLTMFTQAGLFAFEVALFRLLESWGLRPDYLAGHSIGELVAVHVAGAVSLEGACRLVAARGRLMGALPEDGAMVSVQASEQEVSQALTGLEGSVSLAAVNGPSAVVISGAREAVLELARDWERQGRKTKRLRVSHAFHSPCMEPMLDELRLAAEGIEFSRPEIPVLSNVTGEPLTDAQLSDPGYWAEHARAPVRFMDCVGWLEQAEVRNFLELGPDGVLSALSRQILDERASSTGPSSDEESSAGPHEIQTLPTLLRERSESRTLLAALAQMFVRGAANIDWSAILGRGDARRVPLPTYAFQRQRYWLKGEETPRVQTSTGSAVAEGGDDDLWASVEQGDVDALAATLEIEGRLERASLEALLQPLEAWRRERIARAKVDRMRYRMEWKTLPDVSPSRLEGSWLVLLDAGWESDPWMLGIVEALRSGGASTVLVEMDVGRVERQWLAGKLSQALLGDRIESDEAQEASLPKPAGVLSLLAASECSDASRLGVSRGLEATLALVQALGDVEIEGPLWIATRQCVAVSPSDVAERPLQGLVWGLGRAICWEYPQRWGGLIDIADKLDERSGERLCAALSGRSGENQLALRPDGLRGRRIVHAPCGSPQSSPGWQPPRGTVLLTGGTGAIGTHVARWLAGAGAEHLLLASRRGESAPGARELAAELRAMGARVTLAACDVGDRGQLKRLLDSIGEDEPLSAVFHAAGVSRGEWLRSVGAQQLETTLAPKVGAAMHLHELTEHMDLHAFVLFSSITSIFGSAKLGVYSAGNAFLDCLGEHRRSRGLPATSVSWSSWAGEGMAGEEEDLSLRAGLPSMSPELTIRALNQVLDRDEPHLVVADIVWEHSAPVFMLSHQGPLIGDLPEFAHAKTAQAPEDLLGPGQRSFLDSLVGISGEEREQAVLGLVLAELAATLDGSSAEKIGPRRAFAELGLDSVAVIGLRSRLQRAAGCQLPSTMIFDYPDPLALAGYILRKLDDAQRGNAATRLDVPAPIAQSERAGVASGSASTQTLGSLLLQAQRRGSLDEFMRSLSAIARFRPTFDEHTDLSDPHAVATLAHGAKHPTVVCLPSVLAISGPHQYLRFARGFGGERSVLALTLPGFESEELVPASIAAAVQAHVRAVVGVAADGPFVLAGHSSGGALAYALAGRLEAIGIAPAGVAMIDTYSPEREYLGDLDSIVEGMLGRDGAYLTIDDARMTAMGAYLGLLREWEPERIAAPTLLLRAADRHDPEAGIESGWELCDQVVEVPGDHFTAMELHADTAAGAVQEWLAGIGECQKRMR